MVDDGSKDGTTVTAQRLAEKWKGEQGVEIRVVNAHEE